MTIGGLTDESVADIDYGMRAVTHASGVQARLERAEDLAEILDAAYAAFEVMLSVIWRYLDGDGPFYPALVMATAVAASGRDAVLGAPSLPPPSRGVQPAGPVLADDAEAAASLLASLSEALSQRLREAAPDADASADRLACEEAARYADEVQALATGNGS